MTEPKEQFKIKEWRCTVCDYIHIGEEPPEYCPKCNADKKAFVLIEENEEGINPEHGISPEHGKNY